MEVERKDGGEGSKNSLLYGEAEEWDVLKETSGGSGTRKVGLQ
jgi:hypothetical protein